MQKKVVGSLELDTDNDFFKSSFFGQLHDDTGGMVSRLSLVL